MSAAGRSGAAGAAQKTQPHDASSCEAEKPALPTTLLRQPCCDNNETLDLLTVAAVVPVSSGRGLLRVRCQTDGYLVPRHG